METVRKTIEELLLRTGMEAAHPEILTTLILCGVVLAAAWLVDLVAVRVLVPIADRIAKRTKRQWDDAVLSRRPVTAACHIIPVVLIKTVLPAVLGGVNGLVWLDRLVSILLLVTVLRAVIVVLNTVQELNLHQSVNVRQYIRSFCGVLKIVFIFLGVIVVIAILIGQNPATLLAGLGATSAILMLVFKDTIEGLVAGIRLTSSNMVSVGDWITVPSTSADGTVLDISLTTVKIQNFDNTIVTVSPTTLVNGSFRNWKGMLQGAGRQVKRQFFVDLRSIRFLDTDQKATNLEQYRLALEAWLCAHEWVNHEMACVVRLKEATPAGLPVEMYFFLKKKEMKDWEHQSAYIMEHAYALANSYGVVLYQQFTGQDAAAN